ncbi:MAG: hypothetical protein D3911_14310 [Candidatus Electrothrix sp. AW3_4]|nr:hypothetical protein [Candidatus Electrothrix gigas]
MKISILIINIIYLTLCSTGASAYRICNDPKTGKKIFTNGVCPDSMNHTAQQKPVQDLEGQAKIDRKERVTVLIKFQDGTRYNGEVIKGTNIFDGRGKKTTSDGYYEGMWKNGIAHGMGTAYINMMGTYQGQWVNGERDGMFKITASDNSYHQEGMFNRNDKCGKWTTYVHFTWTPDIEYNPALYPRRYQSGDHVNFKRERYYPSCPN